MERVAVARAGTSAGAGFEFECLIGPDEIQLSAAVLKGEINAAPQDRDRFISRDLSPFFVRLPSGLFANLRR